MDKMTQYAFEAVRRYFNVLSLMGHMDKQERQKLQAFLFLEQTLQGIFLPYITEEDYRVIQQSLYSLYRNSCLIPYPQLSRNFSLLNPIDPAALRFGETGLVRESELQDLRTKM